MRREFERYRVVHKKLGTRQWRERGIGETRLFTWTRGWNSGLFRFVRLISFVATLGNKGEEILSFSFEKGCFYFGNDRVEKNFVRMI